MLCLTVRLHHKKKVKKKMSVEELFKHCFSSMGLKVTLTIPKNIGELSVHTINTHYFELLANKLCNQISARLKGDNSNELLLNFIFRTYFMMRAAPSKFVFTTTTTTNHSLIFFFCLTGITYNKAPKTECFFSPNTLYEF